MRLRTFAALLALTLTAATLDPSKYFPVYRVSDAGSPGVPALGNAQAWWLIAVLSNPYWSKRAQHLWFTLRSFGPSVITGWAPPPLQVFYDNGAALPNGNGLYYEVGAGCGVAFVLDRRYEIDAPLDQLHVPCFIDPLATRKQNAFTPETIRPDERPLDTAQVVAKLRTMTTTAQAPVVTPAPVATPIVSKESYEQVSVPLPVKVGAALTFGRVPAAIASPAMNVSNGRLIGNAGEFAVFQKPTEDLDPNGNWALARYHFLGFDVSAGRQAWTLDPVIDESKLASEPQFVLGTDRLFFQANGERTNVISPKDGAIVGSLPCIPSAAVDGVLYCYPLDAYESKTLKRLWQAKVDARTQDAPIPDGSVLLQTEVDFECAGPCFPSVYGYDRATGRQLWSHRGTVLSAQNARAYVNETQPSELDYYAPVTVATLDARTGRVLFDATYAPDPKQNAPANNGSNVFASETAVTGPYAYVVVNGTLYRYDVGRAPGRPLRIDDIEPLAWFGRNNLLVRTKGVVAIGHMERDRLVLHAIPGRLRTVVRAGETRLAVPEQAGAARIYERDDLVRGADGSAYAIVGDDLIAFDRFGTPRALGYLTCPVQNVLWWKNRAAALCAGSDGSVNRALVFADPR